MIGIPINSNIVYIPSVRFACKGFKFDSTYPIHLNGIISRDEFRESIYRINHAYSSNRILTILHVVFGFIAIIGLALFITGILSTIQFSIHELSYLMGIGIVLTTIGTFYSMCACTIINSQRVARMQEVIAEESMKYTSSSRIPCYWKLETIANYVGANGNQYIGKTNYYLVIDICCSTTTTSKSQTSYSNQVSNESSSLLGRQKNDAPPPYSALSIRLCLQCGASQQDDTTKFCISCEHLSSRN